VLPGHADAPRDLGDWHADVTGAPHVIVAAVNERAQLVELGARLTLNGRKPGPSHVS
jgi:hypothetical protein